MNNKKLGLYEFVIEERRREKCFSLFFFSLSLSSVEREKERKKKQKLSSPLETNQLDFFSLIPIHIYIYWNRRKEKRKLIRHIGKDFRCPLLLLFFFFLFKKSFNCIYTKLFVIVDADRMLSIVIIIIVLIQQFSSTNQLKTIQATLASTVELPCSIINQNIEPTNPAKVNAKRDKCLYIHTYIFMYDLNCSKKTKNSCCQGVDNNNNNNNNDIMSSNQLVNVYKYSAGRFFSWSFHIRFYLDRLDSWWSSWYC